MEEGNGKGGDGVEIIAVYSLRPSQSVLLSTW